MNMKTMAIGHGYRVPCMPTSPLEEAINVDSKNWEAGKPIY